MNNPIVWVLVAVAAAVVAGLVFFMSSSPPAGPAPETLIPDAIEGFLLVAKEARIEPVFPGEAYSSHAFYTPAPGGPWSGKIERLGITIFTFKDPTKISEARALLLQGAQTESVALDGHTAELAPEPDGVGLFWQSGALFVAIFVSAPSGSDADIETLKSAALAAGRAVLAKVTR
ncbi:hypothetical protein HRbin07_00016 [bacterium HR07]|uniref:Uncharacterized protein n=2 Tax=Candidatus Bipolaricaulota TaxID=67810 RepID=H5SC67_9BACT|nr:hypothetical protein HGMM_F08F07C12 [uncultured Acetothermia bacterium]BAL59451.1 hypothetical protein HGMM_OP4C087 [Candidatus Acetothermum autotrophicum]GBC75828.1 hypothetical protein HRbin07_00016 [bacterium HR07]